MIDDLTPTPPFWLRLPPTSTDAFRTVYYDRNDSRTPRSATRLGYKHPLSSSHQVLYQPVHQVLAQVLHQVPLHTFYSKIRSRSEPFSKFRSEFRSAFFPRVSLFPTNRSSPTFTSLLSMSTCHMLLRMLQHNPILNRRYTSRDVWPCIPVFDDPVVFEDDALQTMIFSSSAMATILVYACDPSTSQADM